MPAATTLPALPTELLYIITQVSTTVDFLSLLLVNKGFNSVLTPLLYASITLKCYAAAQKCTDTLANDPTTNYDGRDLAACVRSLTVDFQHYGMFGEWRVRFRNTLEISLGRMSGLQHFTFYSAYFGTPRTFIPAMRAAASTLRTLGFRPEENVWWEDQTNARVFDKFRPRWGDSRASIYADDDIDDAKTDWRPREGAEERQHTGERVDVGVVKKQVKTVQSTPCG